jgi:outer membrane protein assembly factor BamB
MLPFYGGGGYGGSGADGCCCTGTPFCPGFNGGAGSAYGSDWVPVIDMGSGGGDGEPGGGAITLLGSNWVIVQGEISVDGGELPTDGGGGSGGGIMINAPTVVLEGKLHANGGAGSSPLRLSGGGGGGRIKIYYSEAYHDIGADLQAYGAPCQCFEGISCTYVYPDPGTVRIMNLNKPPFSPSTPTPTGTWYTVTPSNTPTLIPVTPSITPTPTLTPTPTPVTGIPGSLKWEFITAGDIKYMTGPALGYDNTICFQDNTFLYALYPDGSERWRFPVSSANRASPAIGMDGTIYITTNILKLYAVDPVGPTVIWEFARPDLSLTSAPALAEDSTVYLGTGSGSIMSDGILYAVNPDGTLNWTYPAGVSIFSSPVIAQDGTIYTGTCGSSGNEVLAIDADGSKIWGFPLLNCLVASPAIDSTGTIYIGTQEGYVYAINPDGTKKWEFYTGGIINSAPSIGSDGTVYFGSDDGHLYALDPVTGTELWHFNAGSSLWSSPTIGADGTIYIGSRNGYLYAVNPAGALRWKYHCRGELTCSPLIAPDGTIYVSSGAGNLIALYSDSHGVAKSDWPMYQHDCQRTGRYNYNGFHVPVLWISIMIISVGLIVRMRTSSNGNRLP